MVRKTPNLDMTNIDYKKKYFELLKNVAKLLVENRNIKEPYAPFQLLNKWDKIRDL